MSRGGVSAALSKFTYTAYVGLTRALLFLGFFLSTADLWAASLLLDSGGLLCHPVSVPPPKHVSRLLSIVGGSCEQ